MMNQWVFQFSVRSVQNVHSFDKTWNLCTFLNFQPKEFRVQDGLNLIT